MNRGISWRRIVVALLIGSGVFVGAKFVYGFKISITDLAAVVIFMAVVFGLAALVLVVGDKVSLKPNMSVEEREAATTKRSNRLHGAWGIVLFVLALIALPVQIFGVGDESHWQRLLYGGMAAVIIIGFLLSRYDPLNQDGQQSEDEAQNRED